jgi:hypothetical protein
MVGQRKMTYIPNYLPINRKDYKYLYEALKRLPRIKQLTCRNCGFVTEYPCFLISVKCEACGTSHKTRSFGAYDEMEDLVSIFLRWLDDGPSREKILSTHDGNKTDNKWVEWDEYFAEDND